MVRIENFEFLIIIFVHKNNWNRYFSPIDFLSFQRCGKALSNVISWTFVIDFKIDQSKNAHQEKMVTLYLIPNEGKKVLGDPFSVHENFV